MASHRLSHRVVLGLTTALTALSLLVSGCGGGSSESGSGSSSPSSSTGPGGLPVGAHGDPLCSALWKPGTTMPEHVESCEQPGNVIRPMATSRCPNGDVLVASDLGWAVVGQKVHPLPKGKRNIDDPAYARLADKCTG